MEFVVALSSSADPSTSPALSAALTLRKEGDSVTAVSMGTAKAVPVLKACVAYGADSAFLLSDPDFAGSDTHAVSRILQAFLCKHCEGDFLVFMEESSSPYPTFAVPGRLAGLLGAQQFYYVDSVSRDGPNFYCSQDYGDMKRTCSVPIGSVVFMKSAVALLPEPGEEREPETMDRIALGLGAYSVGKLGSRTAVIPSKGAD